MSDNAGAMSVPRAGVENFWPSHLTWDENARIVGERATIFSQEVPSGHGFCMMIRGSLIDAIGGFDENAFPRGYGEENDYSRRAVNAGFVNLLAPHVLVHHERGATFGEERSGLIETGVAQVVLRHPDYRDKVREWLRSTGTSTLREDLEYAFEAAWSRRQVRPRVLYVLHKAGGGTPQTNMDLMRGLAEYQDSYLLEAVGGHSIALFQLVGDQLVPIRNWRAPHPFKLTDTWREDYASFLIEIILTFNFELVHVRHLINQPLTTLPNVLGMLHVPMILSTHDFYYVCPTVHLIDDRGKFCGASCTVGDGICDLPTPFVRGAPSNLKHDWINVWRERAGSVLGQAAAVIATTESAARLHAETFPDFADRIVIIEHGRDLPISTERQRRKPGPPRVLAAAQWAPHKGEEYIRSLARNIDRDVEWHILGTRGSNLGDIGIVHGAYRRDDFANIAQHIDPDVVAVMATWPETYSHTLTEAWSLGIPVIANDIGAVADRIRVHGGGVILPREADPEAIAGLRHLIDEGLESVDLPRASGIRSVATMAEDYRCIVYQRKGIRPLPVIGLISGQGSGAVSPWSGQVAREADIQGLATIRQAVIRDILSGADTTSYSTIVILGDALSLEDAKDLLALRQDGGFEVVLQLDHDLYPQHGREGWRDPTGRSIKSMPAVDLFVSEADRLIVPTTAIMSLLAERALPCRVAVHETRLDPRLWESRLPAGKVVDFARPLYIGSPGHSEDLEVLSAVPEILSDILKREVRIDVIGEIGGALPKGMDRVQVRDGSYPDLVQDLRRSAHRWNVGLAPLTHGGLDVGFSDMKCLEYAALGLPCVASRRSAQSEGSDSAYYVNDDPSSWADAVAALMTDSDLASELVVRARASLVKGVSYPWAVGAWVNLVAPRRGGG